MRDLTAADRTDLERIRGNHVTFTRAKQAPHGDMFYAEWCGRLEVNVEELLDMIGRLTAPDPSVRDWDADARESEAFLAYREVPSGTGWPVA